MDNLLDKIRDGFQVVFERTEEFSKMGKIKIEISSIHRQIEGLFTELGGEIYTVYKEKGRLGTNDKIKKILTGLENLEEELKKKEEELESVQ